MQDWATDLFTKLADLDSMYELLENTRCGRFNLDADEEESLGVRHDGADIPHQYARVVSRIIEALEELPPFSGGRGLLALQQLRLDLMALDEGHQAQRLAPVKRQVKPGTSAGRRMYQAQVVLCIRLLEEIRESGTKARTHVARIFSEAGHKGQQGEDLSPETLTRWREAVLSPDGHYLAGRRMIERRLAEWKQSPLWPPTLEQALAYVKVRAENPAISLAASK